jgi:hypothetical protein
VFVYVGLEECLAARLAQLTLLIVARRIGVEMPRVQPTLKLDEKKRPGMRFLDTQISIPRRT